MPKIQIPRKIEPILTSKARLIVLVGGRGSAKSESVARALILRAQTERADILCGREYQNSIDDSAFKLIAGLAKSLEVPLSRETESPPRLDIAGGGRFRFKGFSRSPDAVKSAQGFKYSWIEEAHALSEQSIDDLIPTIRAGGSQLFFTANPQASGDPFSQRFIVPFKRHLERDGFYADDLHLIISVNWRDNPWFPEELQSQRLNDLERFPRAKYDHIWEGAFSDHVQDSIILAEWFDAAVDAHRKLGFKPRGARVVSHDPADVGADAKSLALRHGSVILDVQDREDGDANDACDWATDYAIHNGADLFAWDGDGLGASLRRQVADAFEGKRISYVMFKGSESPDRPNEVYQQDPEAPRENGRTNKETFKNKRAQYAWMLRDRFYNTFRAVEKGDYVDPDSMICLSEDIKCLDRLRTETCRIPTKPNGAGLIQIMSKEEMLKKHKMPSPNLFDAVMMSQESGDKGRRTRKPVTYTVPQLKRV